MTRTWRSFITISALALPAAVCAGCAARGSAQENGSGTGPVPVPVETVEAGGVATVEHPERFPLVAADQYMARPALSVTGVVTNDVARAVPVMSLASGRAIDLRVRLGDAVRQGDLLMRVKSPDISSALSDWRHAVADEVLAKAQLDRTKVLYERGAAAQKDL
ncbi:MAG TPA: hypothetical protein VG871_18410, partial [Vicinamibacterales bacterium]|nr:hypothetical protein [Vicinamibacterales bacterium]